jgi:hypothetical protein
MTQLGFDLSLFCFIELRINPSKRTVNRLIIAALYDSKTACHPLLYGERVCFDNFSQFFGRNDPLIYVTFGKDYRKLLSTPSSQIITRTQLCIH